MIQIDQLTSYQDGPETLKKLCLEKIISHVPVNLCQYQLSPELGYCIASAFRELAIAHRFDGLRCESFFKFFKNQCLPLKRINFSHLPITSEFFMQFLREYQDQLEEIDISNCEKLLITDYRTINNILKRTPGDRKTLILGGTCHNLNRESEVTEPRDKLFDNDLMLMKLVIQYAMLIGEESNNSVVMLEDFPRYTPLYIPPTLGRSLKYLDLSDSHISPSQALIQLEKLEILILYNCHITSYLEVLTAISNLKKLRVLDLSRRVTDDEFDPSCEEPRALEMIINGLPDLRCLDISGTNIIGGKDRHISAFETRMKRPFEFLGLFHTGNDAAYRSCLPAMIVAGEANETQILNSCEAYMNRPDQLAKALNDLYNLYKTISPSETFEYINRALDIVLTILTEHIRDEQVIIFTTAALWCIVKINVTTKNLNDARVRRTITRKLLDVMLYHSESRVILTNGGLTLLFLPDIICEHSRVAGISLKMCQDDDPRTQGFGVNLLNTLACQVGGDQKVFIGELNAIEIMLNIITKKIAQNLCDEILETAWSTLWNITDETPVNCQRFLSYNGLETFEECMDRFDGNKEVLRNIMGLLGNVAECQSLRIHFMDKRYIRRFHSLLSSHIDGIECSYNACGILAHLVSDGREFWARNLRGMDNECNLDNVLRDMQQAISRWPINSTRNINYRSFEPIVRLLEIRVAPQAQYWAVFALANLTRINPVKYCPMLLPHDGLKRLQALAVPGVTESYVRNLVLITLYHYERYNAEGTLSGLEQSASINLNDLRNFRAEPKNGDGFGGGGGGDVNDMVF